VFALDKEVSGLCLLTMHSGFRVWVHPKSTFGVEKGVFALEKVFSFFYSRCTPRDRPAASSVRVGSRVNPIYIYIYMYIEW